MESINLSRPQPNQPGENTPFQKQHELMPAVENDRTNRFSSLSLAELGSAALQERQETKYTFQEDRLSTLLSGLESEYYVLEIQGRRAFDYRSVYFDTPERSFFKQHQAGALPRWKIRKRTYLNTGLTFLELKCKDNRKVTLKIRQLVQNHGRLLAGDDLFFLGSSYPGHVSNLSPHIETQYTRITLVHKDREERITVDYHLRFSDGTHHRSLPNLAIAEVKQVRHNNRSPFINRLKRSGIRPGGFSKYCIGSILLQPELKHNHFKPIFHRINSITQGDIHYERPQ